MLATPADAACHKFSIWHYRYPQRCRVMALVHASFRREASLLQEKASFLPKERIDIPLPDLRDIDWGQEGDEHMRGIALLRALRQ